MNWFLAAVMVVVALIPPHGPIIDAACWLLVGINLALAVSGRDHHI